VSAPQRFGTYLVYEEIGKGGQSTVHRAIDGENRNVALKRLLPRVAAHKDLLRSFMQEAALLAHLDHPNIAATYDRGKVGETHFISMEYIVGPTLKQLVAHCANTVGAVPHEIIINLALQLCDALDHAHTRVNDNGKPLGLVHRDVCPANIILSDSGLVKLIDFGLAKAETVNLDTGEGMIKGKFAYLAPEYLGGKLDARCDVWAVGVVMYELLTSKRLFDAPDEFETMNRVRKLPIPRPSVGNPRITPELDAVVMKALERDPAQRWQSAAELRDALREIANQPGNAVDNKHVVDWVRWVFTQAPGSEASGVSKLKRISGATLAAAPVAPEPDPELRPERRHLGWIVLACVAMLAGLLVWKLAG
jgi:eukaryotic-like serine/threonine-protein kinase